MTRSYELNNQKEERIVGIPKISSEVSPVQQCEPITEKFQQIIKLSLYGLLQVS